MAKRRSAAAKLQAEIDAFNKLLDAFPTEAQRALDTLLKPQPK